jgi:hypothetical protein
MTSITTINTTNTSNAQRAVTTHRNRSCGFQSGQKAHNIYAMSLARTKGEASEKHKRVISKAILRRQSKGYAFIEESDLVDEEGESHLIDSVTRKIRFKTNEQVNCRDVLCMESFHIAVNRPQTARK